MQKKKKILTVCYHCTILLSLLVTFWLSWIWVIFFDWVDFFFRKVTGSLFTQNFLEICKKKLHFRTVQHFSFSKKKNFHFKLKNSERTAFTTCHNYKRSKWPQKTEEKCNDNTQWEFFFFEKCSLIIEEFKTKNFLWSDHRTVVVIPPRKSSKFQLSENINSVAIATTASASGLRIRGEFVEFSPLRGENSLCFL